MGLRFPGVDPSQLLGHASSVTEGLEGPPRRQLVLETWFVMVAFLLPGVADAVAVFARLANGGHIGRFPTIVSGHPLANLVLAMFTYLTVASVVPLAVLLLQRTGDGPATLGLERPRFRRDWVGGSGLALGGFGLVFVTVLVLRPVLSSKLSVAEDIDTGSWPNYYIALGVLTAAVTAITEETLVSGYLLTRLEQLGWQPRRALALSLALRTSYHVYYGLGFLVTIPIGYVLTRSFQKHRRLARPIVAHFLYDAVLFTIGILVH